MTALVLASAALVAPAAAQELPPLTVPSTLPPVVTVPPVNLPVAPEVSLPGTGTAVVLPPLTVPPLLPGTAPPSPAPTQPPARDPGREQAPVAVSYGSKGTATDAGPQPPARPAPVGSGGARPASVPAAAPPARLAQAAAATVRQLGFPMVLTLALLGFLVVQHRLDAGDRRLAAPAGGEDELLRFS